MASSRFIPGGHQESERSRSQVFPETAPASVQATQAVDSNRPEPGGRHATMPKEWEAGCLDVGGENATHLQRSWIKDSVPVSYAHHQQALLVDKQVVNTMALCHCHLLVPCNTVQTARPDVDAMVNKLLDAAHLGHANRHLLHPISPTYSMFAWRTEEASNICR